MHEFETCDANVRLGSCNMSTPGEKTQSNILSILHQHRTPMSAYDLLKEMRKAKPKIAPTTIYRALASLVEDRRIHRVESLSAYAACQRGDRQNTMILSICEDCGSVEERVAADLLVSFADVIGEFGFSPKRHVIEVHGICAACRDLEFLDKWKANPGRRG